MARQSHNQPSSSPTAAPQAPTWCQTTASCSTQPAAATTVSVGCSGLLIPLMRQHRLPATVTAATATAKQPPPHSTPGPSLTLLFFTFLPYLPAVITGGDAYYETRWDVPGPIQTTYVSGQTINVDIVVAVNHLGRMSLQICQLDAKPGAGKCKVRGVAASSRQDSCGAQPPMQPPAGTCNCMPTRDQEPPHVEFNRQNLYLKMPKGKGIKSWYLPGINDWTGGNYGGEGPRYGEFDALRSPHKPPQFSAPAAGVAACSEADSSPPWPSDCTYLSPLCLTGDGTYEAYRMPEVRDNSGWGCRGQALCDQFKVGARVCL